VVPRMLGWDKARSKARAAELMDMVASSSSAEGVPSVWRQTW
jgi:ABC-type proline/glycine betaine transport system ATPase subunit